MKSLTTLIAISILTVSIAESSHANLIAPDLDAAPTNPVLERYVNSGFDPSILWFFPLEGMALPEPEAPNGDAAPALAPAPESAPDPNEPPEPPEPTIYDPCGPSAPSILGPRQPWLRMLVPGASK